MLTMSNTTIQAFDGHNFVPKGVLPKFAIDLGGKLYMSMLKSSTPIWIKTCSLAVDGSMP